MTSPALATPAPKNRLHYLDGLRGLFALCVFVFHLLGSNLQAIQFFAWQQADEGIAKSPFGALLAGWQFVLAFFVLSGIALTLPLLKQGRKFNWIAYYPSRLLRLYLPAVGSIGLAALVIANFGRDVTGKGTDWLQTQAVHHLSFLDWYYAFTLDNDQTVVHLNAPLWSLRWEIIFSLALPLLFLILLLVIKRFSFGWLLFALLGIIALASYTRSEPLLYMSVFPLGMLWATRLEKIQLAATAVMNFVGRGLFTYGTVIVVIMLFWLSGYKFVGIFGAGIDPSFVFAVLAALVATLLMIFVASTSSPLHTFLTNRFMKFLGKISFSLYLTHLPIITLIAYVVPPGLWYVNVLIAVPTCFLVAFLFWYLIERPIHLGSRVIRDGIARFTDRFWQELADRTIAALNAPIGNTKKPVAAPKD